MAAQAEQKRQYLVVVAAVVLLVIVGGYLIYTWMVSSDTPASQLAPVSAAGAGQKTHESQHYSASLKAYNDANAKTAESSGKTYLAALSTNGETDSPPTAATAPPPPRQAPAPPPARRPHQIQMRGYGGRVLSSDDMKSLKGMMEQWSDGGLTDGGVLVATTYAASLNGPPTAPSRGGTADSATNADASAAAQREAALRTIIVKPYARTYAMLDTQVNTDDPSMVRAIVPPGMPYAGAVLYASSYQLQGNDVTMQFDAMVYRGRAYKVTAKPFDMKTGRTALSGDVTHHYFARIVLPALAQGLASTGELFAQAGQQSVVTPQGAVVSTSPSTPSARNIAGTFVGGIGQASSNVLQQQSGKVAPTTTQVNRAKMIGIQFVGAVTGADALGAKQAPDSAGGTPAAAPTTAQTARQAAAAQNQPRVPTGLRYARTGAAAGG